MKLIRFGFAALSLLPTLAYPECQATAQMYLMGGPIYPGLNSLDQRYAMVEGSAYGCAVKSEASIPGAGFQSVFAWVPNVTGNASLGEFQGNRAECNARSSAVDTFKIRHPILPDGTPVTVEIRIVAKVLLDHSPVGLLTNSWAASSANVDVMGRATSFTVSTQAPMTGTPPIVMTCNIGQGYAIYSQLLAAAGAHVQIYSNENANSKASTFMTTYITPRGLGYAESYYIGGIYPRWLGSRS